MAAKKKKIWLSATSIQDDDLRQIIAVLPKYYKIICSHEILNTGNPKKNVWKNHLDVLKSCDLFLGIINPKYSDQAGDTGNVFLKEIKAAIDFKMPYWFLVHRDVTFSRNILEKIEPSKDQTPISKDKKLFDERTIDIYKHIIKKHNTSRDGNSHAPIDFYRLNDLASKIDKLLKGLNRKVPPKLMVASTVYGFEDQLSKIISDIELKGFRLLNSYYGSIKVNPKFSNLKNCLAAVAESDLFLGIVRPYYGTGNINEKNITFEEIKKAIKLLKSRWFLIHRNVVFAEMLFKSVRFDSKNHPKLVDNKVIDNRAIKLYNFVIKDHEKNLELRNGNWAQEYYHPSEMLVYIRTQFSDKSFIEGLLNN